jgi:2-polyprenyl-3-methyl-5-hydroxy-6-metoxy-1,4-benzoquinol methylase
MQHSIDRARGGRRFETAFEVGCCEGAFTEIVANRSESLLAVDFCAIALDRARRRCKQKPRVNFQLFALRRDAVPGRFQLVLAMDVLHAFRRPGVMRAAVEKLIECAQPSGYLLLTDHRQHPVFESAWWGKRLVPGGKWILSAVAENPALIKLEDCRTSTHVLALFRRRETVLI